MAHSLVLLFVIRRTVITSVGELKDWTSFILGVFYLECHTVALTFLGYAVNREDVVHSISTEK